MTEAIKSCPKYNNFEIRFEYKKKTNLEVGNRRHTHFYINYITDSGEEDHINSRSLVTGVYYDPNSNNFIKFRGVIIFISCNEITVDCSENYCSEIVSLDPYYIQYIEKINN